MLSRKSAAIMIEFQKLNKDEKTMLWEFMKKNIEKGEVLLMKEAQDQGLLADTNDGVCPVCKGTGRL